jgi:hypothetical protein
MARVSSGRSQSSKHHRVYWAHQRTADVLSVGEVVLLFSNKPGPGQMPAGGVQKVLMSNAAGASAEQLLRWYALRWQVELFFKEMKGQLGLGQYKTRHFARVAGWVGLCVLAFCYLEWQRLGQLRKAGKPQRPYWQAARAPALRARLRQQVERADVLALLRAANSARGRKRLNDLLQAGYDDPTDPRGRRRCA